MTCKFTHHIPNYCDGFEPKIFEFTDLDDLANKLGKDKSSLVFDDEHILSVSKDGTQWRVLGRVEKRVEGLREWRGSPHTVVEIESVRGWGLDTFEPKLIGDSFTIYSKEDIECYWGFKNTIMGELKDGRCFLGVDK
jgi:hypothetical protein